MHAGTGYWTRQWYLANTRAYLDRLDQEEQARKDRRAHRSLPRARRLVVDLDKVRARLSRIERDSKSAKNPERRDALYREGKAALRNWNRLMKMLNKEMSNLS